MTFTLVYQSQISIHSVCLGKYKDNLWLNQILSEGLLTPYVCVVCVCVCVCVCGGGGGGGGGAHTSSIFIIWCCMLIQAAESISAFNVALVVQGN